MRKTLGRRRMGRSPNSTRYHLPCLLLPLHARTPRFDMGIRSRVSSSLRLSPSFSFFNLLTIFAAISNQNSMSLTPSSSSAASSSISPFTAPSKKPRLSSSYSVSGAFSRSLRSFQWELRNKLMRWIRRL
jgi:hypothetical protein